MSLLWKLNIMNKSEENVNIKEKGESMRKKIIWKKGISVVMSMAMAVSIMPTSFAMAASKTTKDGGVEVLADFNFDSEAQDGAYQGGNAKAAVNGTCGIQERDVENGNALYLDGNKSYLNVTDNNGKSLLSGKEEITISYDAKADQSQKANWVFFASDNTDEQKYPNEHYLAVLEEKGKTSIQRFKNAGSRPASASAQTGSDWVHVDVVVEKDKTKLYVNKELKANVSSTYQLKDILGTESILQIGKANWGTGGEYYKGYIDNLKVYGEALTDQDIMGQEAANQAEYDALTIYGADENNVVDNVKNSVTLPTKGKYDSEVTWKTSDSSVVSTTGDVTRPAKGEAVKEVTLTATINGTEKHLH